MIAHWSSLHLDGSCPNQIDELIDLRRAYERSSKECCSATMLYDVKGIKDFRYISSLHGREVSK